MTKKLLIGISGKARSGKDACAKILWRDHGFSRMAFADPLKLAAQNIFGLSDDETWDDALKEVVLPYWGVTPRRIFQLLGTECVRSHFGDDLWIKRWKLSYDALLGTSDVVLTDVRFEPEAAALRKEGGVIVHLSRLDSGLYGESAGHSSESGVAFAQGDFFIDNNGSLDDLSDKLFELVSSLREGGAA